MSGILISAVLPGLPTVVKLVDKETLLKEREEKKKVSGEVAAVRHMGGNTGGQFRVLKVTVLRK